MAKNENPDTSAAAAGDVACSAASGSAIASIAPPERATASRASSACAWDTEPRSAASHSTNIANGIAVPAMSATFAFLASPSSEVATTGTTLWNTNASAMTGIVEGTAVQSPVAKFWTSTFAAPSTKSGAKVKRTMPTSTEFMSSSLLGDDAKMTYPRIAAYAVPAAPSETSTPRLALTVSAASWPTLEMYATNSA